MSNKKKSIKADDFIANGLSIDESRVSILILSYIVSFFTTVSFALYSKDLDTLASVFFATTTAVAGINITSSIMNGVGKNNTGKLPDITETEKETDDWPRG